MSNQKTPTVFIGFANDPNNPLPQLVKERKSIREEFDKLDEHKVRVEHEDFLDVDSLLNCLKKYEDKLVVFHYGGHANDKVLGTLNSKAHSGGLSSRLAQMPNLKLVFLNGCATQSLVKDMIGKGVKVVIATYTSVNDEKAAEFAKRFYSHFAQGKTIREAFDSARADMLTKHQDLDKETSTRGFMSKDEYDALQNQSFPWACYAKEENNFQDLGYQIIGLSPDTEMTSISNAINPLPPNNYIKLLSHLNQFYSDGEYHKFESIFSDLTPNAIKNVVEELQKGEYIEIKKGTGRYVQRLRSWVVGDPMPIIDNRPTPYIPFEGRITLKGADYLSSFKSS